MYNVKSITCIRGDGRRDRRGETGIRVNPEGGQDNVSSRRIFISKIDCYEKIRASVAKYVTTQCETYDSSINYTTRYNSWLMACHHVHAVDKASTSFTTGGCKVFTRTRGISWASNEGPINITVTVTGDSSRGANNKSCWSIMRKVSVLGLPSVQSDMFNNSSESNQNIKRVTYYNFDVILRLVRETLSDLPRVQMDSGVTEQGEMAQGSHKANNTIITSDQTVAKSVHNKSLDTMEMLCSSEPIYRFPSITNRWVPLKSITFSSNADVRLLDTINIPEDLYRNNLIPNLNPFETFIYGKMDVELRLVMNGNKFHVGKLMMCSKYDSYQANLRCNNVASGIARNHVIVDISSNNEGTIKIPFRFHRPYMRLYKGALANSAVYSSLYATVDIYILSNLNTGTGGPSEIHGRLFFRFTSAEFSGMSYRVPVTQMGDECTEAVLNNLHTVLVQMEGGFKQMGRSNNQDKPSQLGAITVIPHPKLNFTSGQGLTDVLPMRLNPVCLTNYVGIELPTDEPRNYAELARIWGFWKRATWSASTDVGAEVISLRIDPTLREYSDQFVGVLTPIEYACSNFMFWTGTIEIRIDFVSNAYHTGSLQLSAEFSRATSEMDLNKSSSTYTKVFHLGEQKSVTFTVPYIYDTPMRRSAGGVSWYTFNDTGTTNIVKSKALSVSPVSNTYFKARVVNGLRPPNTVAQSIELLVFIRAGPNFRMHGLKGNTCRRFVLTDMDNFPEHYVQGTIEKKKAVQVPDNLKNSSIGKGIAHVVEGVKTTVAPSTVVPVVTTSVITTAVASMSTTTPSVATVIPSSVVTPTVNSKPVVQSAGRAHASTSGANQRGARTQMDNGDKEDMDSTADFGIGRKTDILMSDYHMDFKDLLRKPVLLLWQKKVLTGYNSSFYIPCMPPDIAMHGLLDNFWCKTLASTTASNILSMFRAWRGSMRYTIVCHTSGIIYVSYIPHSGVRISGNHYMTKAVEVLPVCGENFFTEIIVPKLNPIITVEVPYDTENTWTLMGDDYATKDYLWRDKADYNSGHLVITAPADAIIDVWWSAGNDFELSNFYGMPFSISQHPQTLFETDRIVPTTDFQVSEITTKVDNLPVVQMDKLEEVSDVIRGVLQPKVVVKAAIGAIPFVGTPLVIADTVNTLNTNINDMKVTSIKTMEDMSSAANKFGIATEQLTSLLHETVEKITNTVSGIVTGAGLLYDIILDLLVAWLDKSWTMVGIGLVRCVTKLIDLPGVVLNIVLKFGAEFSNFLTNLYDSSIPRVQVEVDHGAVYVGLLCGLVGTIYGVHIDRQRWQGTFTSSLLHRLTQTSGISYLVQIMSFIKSTFSTLKDIFMEGLGYVSPEAKALQRLSQSNEMIKEFVRDAQIITSESNSGLLNNPQYRRRFWFCVLHAHQIQQLLCAVPTNCVSFQVSKLCMDVIKTGNDKFMDVSASPVRFEPMVICIEGPAGVGKSYSTEDLAGKLLKAIKYEQTCTEMIFYRTAGEKYWSGYRDQPVVVYDEWLNTTDPTRCIDQIAEMMKLKSTSLFIPEMAHLEEKRIKGNPLIVIICCNNAFPTTLGNYAQCPQAILRRRDVVLNVTRTGNFHDVNLREVTGDDIERVANYEHLQYRNYKHVAKKDSISLVCKSYAETSNWLVGKWINYYKFETEQVRKRMERLPQYMASMENGMPVQDPFALFYQLGARVDQDPGVQHNGYTHYEQLEAALTIVNDALRRPPTPLELPEVEYVRWEDAVAADPNTQLWTEMTIGALLYGWIPNVIAKASLATLSRWEIELNPHRTIAGVCNVCLVDTPCAYVCPGTMGTEANHMVCIECYTGMVTHGNGSCPVCRHPCMIPYVGMADLATISVWTRLANAGLRSMSWVCKKFIQYYKWKTHHPVMGMLAEMLFEIAYLYVSAPLIGTTNAVHSMSGIINTVGAQRYAYAGMFMWNTRHHLTNLMVDYETGDLRQTQNDWEDEGEPVIVEQGVEEVDELAINLNLQIVNSYIDTAPVIVKPLCLHRRLLQNVRLVQLYNTHWRLTDVESAQCIDIPIWNCGEHCYLHEAGYPAYLTFFQQYKQRESAHLRVQYIRYVNDPCDELREVIPEVFQASWMQSVDVPDLTNWWEWLSDRWTRYRAIFIYCTAGIAVMASLIGTYRLMSSLSDVSSLATQAGATAGSSEPSQRNPRRGVNRVRTREAYFNSAPLDDVEDETWQETQVTPTLDQVLERYISGNMFKFMIKIGQKSKVMFGTGLFGHYVLIPRHYVREIEKYVKHQGLSLYGCPVASPHLEAIINLDWRRVVSSPQTDLAYIQLPPKFAMFKDIRKFLALDADLDRPLTSEGKLLLNPKGATNYVLSTREVTIYGIEENISIMDQDDNRFSVREAITYNFSRPGACGSILVRSNHQRPILAMHFAGESGPHGKGFGVPLTQEALAHLCTLNQEPVKFEDGNFESIAKANFIYDFEPDEEPIRLHYLGSLVKEKVPYIPSKSKIRESAIYRQEGLISNMEPAILDRNDSRYIHQISPLRAGVRKHGILTEDFDPLIVERAGEMLWDGWLANIKPLIASPHPLTLEQCIIGIPEINHYAPMDLNTSAGYPLNLNKQKTRKSDYIILKRDDQLQPIGIESIDIIILDTIEYKEGLRKQGIVPLTYFVDTLKDEKRLSSKVMQLGGTRVFCSSPVDYVIACRKYFMHFVASFMEYRHDVMSAVGINPTSLEWTQLINNLLKRNHQFGTIDYSNFGPGYNSSVAKMAYSLIIRWTMLYVKDEKGQNMNEQEMWCLIYECLQSTHICGNTVYQQGAGSPSGAFFTTIINTLVNQIYLLLAWIILVEKVVKERDSKLLLGPEFKRNVTLYCYGDDAIFSVSPEYQELYNMLTITTLFKEYNIVATDATKSQNIAKFEDISNSQFLKRGFKKHPKDCGKWLAPLVWESVESSSQWVWQSENLNEATRANALASLMEAYGHGIEKFNKYKLQLNKALARVGIDTLSGTWDEFDTMFMDMGFEFDIDTFLIKNL